MGCHFLLLWIMCCQNSSLWPVHLGWPCMAWLIASLSYASTFAMKRLWSMKRDSWKFKTDFAPKLFQFNINGKGFEKGTLHLEKAMAPHCSTLAWKIPWTEEPGRLQSMGSLGVGHDWATSLSLFTFMHWRRKWQPTPVFLPGESQGRGSMVGCSLWVAQSRTQLKWRSGSSSNTTSALQHAVRFRSQKSSEFQTENKFICRKDWLQRMLELLGF